jgi:hypothetical protein
MNLIVMTKYTLSAEFVQVHGNNHCHWRTSQVQQKNLELSHPVYPIFSTHVM